MKPRERLEKRLSKWLPIPDDGSINLICATYLANQLDGPPVWLLLVPSLDYARELVVALGALPRTHRVEELSRGSLASGYKGSPGIRTPPADDERD